VYVVDQFAFNDKLLPIYFTAFNSFTKKWSKNIILTV
jgi:hypothetical protein